LILGRKREENAGFSHKLSFRGIHGVRRTRQDGSASSSLRLTQTARANSHEEVKMLSHKVGKRVCRRRRILGSHAIRSAIDASRAGADCVRAVFGRQFSGHTTSLATSMDARRSTPLDNEHCFVVDTVLFATVP
jgi:hypothetical protein